MNNKKLEQLQKMYEDGLITENELKAKREKIISEIIDSDIDPDKKTDSKTIDKPKKKNKVLKIILISIGVFFGFCFICSLFDDRSETENRNTKNVKTEESVKENKTAKADKKAKKQEDKLKEKLGKWYKLDDNYEIKITSLEKTNYFQYGDYVFTPEAGNTYISICFSYRNISNVPIGHLLLSSDEFKCFYLQSPDGKKYETDMWGSTALFYETLSLTEKLECDLNNGNINKGYLKPFSDSFETGKNGFAIEIPKDKMQEKGWKLVVNDLEMDVTF